MDNLFSPYETHFTVEERRQMVAQALQDLRKAQGYSQKEVAALLGLAQPTYSSYERGRTEPSIETLVRISYLYKVSIDLLVQRDRLYTTAKDAEEKIRQATAELQEMEHMVSEQGNEELKKFFDALRTLTENTGKLLEIPGIKEKIDSPVSGVKSSE